MTAVRPSSSLPSVSAPYSAERGGMIIIIFIMVALFAALSYAVSDSFRLNASSTNVVSEEKMRLAFVEMQNFIEAQKLALRTMTANGISIDKIDVGSEDAVGTQYEGGSNTDCTTDECRVFKPKGGGLKFYMFAKIHPELSRMPDENRNGMWWTLVSGRGTTAADVIYTVSVTKEFCNFINKQQGINIDIDLTDDVSIETHYGVGAGSRLSLGVVDHVYSFTAPGQGGHLQGQSQGCYRSTGSHANGTNPYYYFALIYPT